MPNVYPRTIFVTALVAVAASTVARADESPRPSAADATRTITSGWEDAHTRWIAAMRKLNVPGAAVVAVHGDQVVLLDALGVRDPQSGAPVTPDTAFYIASSTKSFVAMATCALAEEGRVDLDSPVINYLPRFAVADDDATRTITLVDLLSHRRGLDSSFIAIGEAYTGLMTEDVYYRLLRQVKPVGEFRYSNLHYTLAGRVILAVTGKSWKAYLTERILLPAGMTRTLCNGDALYADADVAMPTIEVDGHWQPAGVRKTDRTMHAAGGIGTTAVDLGRWLRLNLGDGQIDGKRIVSADTVAAMLSPHATADEAGVLQFHRDGYGLGWFLGDYRGHRMVHHFGGYVGARAHVSFLPDDDVGVAVVVNMSGPAFGFAEYVAGEVYDQLLKLEREDRLPQLAEQTEQARKRGSGPRLKGDPLGGGSGLSLDPEKYAGHYVNPDLGMLEIAVEDGTLAVTLGDMHPLFVTADADDAFIADWLGEHLKGRFEVADGTRVVGCTVSLNPLMQLRFEKQ